MTDYCYLKLLRLRKDKTLVYSMLVLSIASIFIFQNSNVGFDKSHHGFLSSHGAAIAKNLSIRHNLLMFHAKEYDNEGNLVYEPYNRFPIFPFLIIKFVMLLFEPDLAKQVYYSRMLMSLFLSLSIYLTFLMVCKLCDDHYKALAITLLSFSSYYILLYGDMIFNDIPALFGFVLSLFVVLHCSYCFHNKYLVSALVITSISMGWQPLAVYLSWFLFEAFSFGITKFGYMRNKRTFNLKKSPAFLFFLVALIWASLVLTFQLGNEWVMVGGSFMDIPSVQSLIGRIGLASGPKYVEYSDSLVWPKFLVGQGKRIVTSIVPLYLKESCVKLLGKKAYILLIVGAFVVAGFEITKIVREKKCRANAILFVLGTSGILWNIGMKNYTAFHGFQSIFYVGLAILIYFGGSYIVRNSSFKYITPLVVVFFLLSIYQINVTKNNLAWEINEITYEFQSIYNKLPKGSKVYFDDGKTEGNLAYHAMNFYLVGHYFSSLNDAGYIISRNGSYNRRRITHNNQLNLFQK